MILVPTCNFVQFLADCRTYLRRVETALATARTPAEMVTQLIGGRSVPAVKTAAGAIEVTSVSGQLGDASCCL
jgi:hypothetical protein